MRDTERERKEKKGMTHGNLIDLTGKRFGRWTVLERAHTHKERIYWWCQCDCGTIKTVQGTSLTRDSKSCGCLRREMHAIRMTIDLTGQRFGRLTVLSRADKRNKFNHVMWNCICDCGNRKIISGCDFSNGVKSCGCLWKENQIIKNGKKRCSTCKQFKDLSEFHICRRNRLSDYSSQCKDCRRITFEKYSAEHKEEINLRSRKLKTKYREELPDVYIKQYLVDWFGLDRSQITPEMIQTKREQLMVHRALKQFKQEVVNE